MTRLFREPALNTVDPERSCHLEGCEGGQPVLRNGVLDCLRVAEGGIVELHLHDRELVIAVAYHQDEGTRDDRGEGGQDLYTPCL